MRTPTHQEIESALGTLCELVDNLPEDYVLKVCQSQGELWFELLDPKGVIIEMRDKPNSGVSLLLNRINKARRLDGLGNAYKYDRIEGQWKDVDDI